jgi:hypothetical protein
MQSIIYISNNDDFLVIDLAKEYSNYKDSIPYAIVTDLSEEYLNTTYGDEIKEFTPFIILTHEMLFSIALRNSETFTYKSPSYTCMAFAS